MKKLVITALLTLTSPFIFAERIFAGQSLNSKISINQERKEAFGLTGSALNRSYTSPRIGCYTQSKKWNGNVEFYGVCTATSDSDDIVFCQTEEPKMIQQIQSISGKTYIHFRWSTATGLLKNECESTRIKFG